MRLCVLFLAAGLAAAEKPRWRDAHLKKVAYDPNYSVPPGFLKEPREPLYYHQVHWVATEKAVARKMVETLLQKSDIPDDQKKIVAQRETKRGFDFKTKQQWYRVHKRSYFAWAYGWVANQGHVPSGASPPPLGTFRTRPLTAKVVREFAEYDTWIRRQEKVLASEGTESKTHFIHHVETLSVTGGDWGISDTLHRFRVIYKVEKTTGKTVKLRERVRELKGRGARG